MRRILVLVALLAVFGCGEESQLPAPAAESTPQQAATPRRDGPTEVEMVAAMEAHYSVVILAHDALLHGDLAGFRSQLALVPEQSLPPSSPDAWLPLYAQLQVAASEGASASDLDAAARSLSAVVLACGSCHVALGSGPVYPAPAPEGGANVVEAAMLDHKWASERLWEGVTGPWDNAWQRGADAMAVVQVFGDLGEEVILSDDLLERERQLRALGEEARTTSALDERAVLYGRLLSTCGECHQAVGVRFE